jgi:phosphoglycerol transferase MdoB-like AlkP superfamily enzyme
MYFAFDETDDFAHGGEYAAYLNAANYTDGFIGQLWNYIQSEPQYKDKTTLIIAVDHGRGVTSEEWKHHGTKIEHADEIWLAVMGPDTPATGEAKTDSQYYQNQIAKTLAAFLALDFGRDSKVGDTLTAGISK